MKRQGRARSIAFLSLLLTLALLVPPASLLGFGAARVVSADNHYVLQDSYDDLTVGQLPQDYSVSPNPPTSSNRVTASEAPGRSGHALYLEDHSSSAQTQLIRDLEQPLTGIVTVEFDWYHEGSARASSLRPMKIFSSTAESSSTTIVELQTRDGGRHVAQSIQGTHHQLITDFAADTWYQFKLVMNTTTKKVDTYVNGQLVLQQADFASSSASQVHRLKVYSQNSPAISQYIDNLTVYTGSDSGSGTDPDGSGTNPGGGGTDPDGGGTAPGGGDGDPGSGTDPGLPPEPAAGDLIVAPHGLDSHPGTLTQPTTLTSAIARIQPGQTIYMRGGTYSFSNTVLIERGNNGQAGARKRIASYNDEKPVLDFSAQAFDPMNRGLQINGHYWHVYGIEVKEAGDNGIFIGGNYNRIENVETHHNKDSGLQISRYASTATRDEWPSYNEIIRVYSHNNYDPDDGEDADGFAAKLTSGPGNVFDSCIAAYNVDDGWDLFAKNETGPIDPVTIRNSIAYNNGATSSGLSTSNSDGNGFKLGGSNIAVNHIVENNIAFGNKKHGFTFNSNPGSITMRNNTSWNNGTRSGSNFAFDKGTHQFANNLSFQASSSDKYASSTDIAGSNLWWHNTKGSVNANLLKVTAADFISLTPTVSRDANGTPVLGDFLKLTPGSSLKGAGTPAGTDIGASFPASDSFASSAALPAAALPAGSADFDELVSPAASAAVLREYDLTGFAAAGGTTGAGTIAESDSRYVKVYNAEQLGIALKRRSPVKVVEIMNDLNLGWNEISSAARTAPFYTHNAPSTHPVLLQTGVSKIELDGFDGLTIFSRNGAKIKHAAFVIKRSNNVVIRNLEFDELWEWDELSKGDYDKKDWDYITLESSSNIWIDHCTFNKAYDGVVDSKKGTSGVTISWSLFRGDNGSAKGWVAQQINAMESNRSAYPMYNYLRGLGLTTQHIIALSAGQKKGHLVGANELASDNSQLTITLHHNYYKDMMDRLPRLRGGNAHVYNIVADSSQAHASSAILTNTMKQSLASKGYKFGVTSNGAIATENGAVLVESSSFIDVQYPLRNNQKDPSKPQYTGKIRAVNTLYSMNGSSFKGSSDTAGSPLAPVPAPIIAFSWNGFTALPYSYIAVQPETLASRLTSSQGAGAGKLQWSSAQWLQTTGGNPL